ncbi:MAG: hypothetical protein HYR56_23145 [Acidobacteria bacterium]|nr:hypothetical protein [Acidobacteriota bacterium]MBI3427832.1 hypothetical protein [Acidobacteriota bacterium]
MKTKLKKLLAAPFLLLAALIVLLEDWLWDDLLLLAVWLGRLPVLRQLEALIAALPPYGALTVFAAPSLLLVPVKLIGLWFLAHGHAGMGVLTALAAKIIGTALVARIYALTEKKLLQIAWFARWHERFVLFKARVYAVIKASQVYQVVHQQKLRLKTWLRTRGRSFLRQRWEAAVRLSRRWRRIKP